MPHHHDEHPIPRELIEVLEESGFYLLAAASVFSLMGFIAYLSFKYDGDFKKLGSSMLESCCLFATRIRAKEDGYVELPELVLQEPVPPKPEYPCIAP